MDFEWDRNKAARNFTKHAVSFHEAVSVFGDTLSITYRDPDHSATEQRFMTVGMSSKGHILLVAHTERGDRTRIISARRTTARERRQYEERSQDGAR